MPATRRYDPGISDLLAARSQMAMSLAFHIVFAALGMGMPLLMVIAEARWLKTRDPVWLELVTRWTKATAVLFAVALPVLCIMALVQPLSGDLCAKLVARLQPAKLAAMEGQFRTEAYAPLRIGGFPEEEAHETRWAIEVPGGLSYLAYGKFEEVVSGLGACRSNLLARLGARRTGEQSAEDAEYAEPAGMASGGPLSSVRC